MTIDRDEVNQLLEEKDQLISALTERLEMAAEQLDRLHRTGADRSQSSGGSATGGAAVPAEMLEDQRQMMENIQQMFGEWDEMPAAASLGRIETQISEVRDLIVQLSNEGVNVRGTAPAGGSQSSSMTSDSNELEGFDLPADVMGESTQASESNGAAADQAVSDWDAIKAGLLGEEVPPPADNPVSSPEAQTEPAESTPAHTPVSSPPPVEEVPEANAPAEIDLESATREELCEAIVQREDYITWILSQLFAHKNPQFDWDNLPTVPEELQHRLHHLETQLEAKMRMAEVSCAMERARIGRDEARIKQIEQQAQRLLKRLGVSEQDVQMQAEMPKMESPVSNDDQAASGKWRRLLGLGQNDE